MINVLITDMAMDYYEFRGSIYCPPRCVNRLFEITDKLEIIIPENLYNEYMQTILLKLIRECDAKVEVR